MVKKSIRNISRSSMRSVLLAIGLSVGGGAMAAGNGGKADSLKVHHSNFDFAPDEPDSIIRLRVSQIQSEIPISYNNKIRKFIDYFTINHRDYTRKIMTRSEMYFPMIEEILRQEGVPDDLKYLTIVESALNPKARSRVGALGLWQFMPATGKMYKLDYDWYVDERMDPYKATVAAARYLKTLHGMFNDWELALAAYNCGPGNVRRAIRRSGYKKTFWEIYNYLPRETRGYVPQFMAVNYVMRHTDEHNLFIENAPSLQSHDTYVVNQYVNLDVLARELNLCKEEILALNPEIKRDVVPAHLKNYELRLPCHKMPTLKDKELAILDSVKVRGKEELNQQVASKSSTAGKQKLVYKVKSGDVLGSIAQRYHVRVSDLRRWNGISGNRIYVGQRLAIYKDASYFKASPRKSTTPARGQVYIVQPGDSLWSISRKYGMSVDQLKRINGLRSNGLKAGQRLKLG